MEGRSHKKGKVDRERGNRREHLKSTIDAGMDTYNNLRHLYVLPTSYFAFNASR